MTAEFAIVLPAVVVVLGIAVGGIGIAAHRITLVSIAGELARYEARGDDAEAQVVLARLDAGVEVKRDASDAISCVTLFSRPAGGLLSVITVSATACSAITS